MPELPEVEFARRQILAQAAARRIVRAETFGPGVEAPAAAVRRWTDVGTRAVLRRGKTLLWLSERDDAAVLLHLGMTGGFRRTAPGAPPPPHTRARWIFADGDALVLTDPRRFGRVRFADEAALRDDPSFARPAPDPLVDACGPETLRRAFGRVRAPLKPALMDQARLLGLGNIHAAEACFRARLDPRRPCASLDAAEFARLWAAIETTIAYGLATLGPVEEEVRYAQPGEANPFLVYDRAGLPCPGCGRPLTRFTQAARSTYACLVCQR
jgi:formamidopyrimidine-DNA glycosylase